MKTLKNVFAIVSLILVSMMIWFSCEKENDLTPYNRANITESLDLPTVVADHLTDSEINAYYNDVVAAEKNVPSPYRLRTVAIVMDNEIEYISGKGMPAPTGMIFSGSGIWKDFGTIRYTEAIDPLRKLPAPKGEGCIFLSRYEGGKDVIEIDQLNFVSSMRKEVVYQNGSLDKKTPPGDAVFGNKTIKSRIDFERGQGIFDAAHGVATKKEVYYPDKPNYCKSVIYGYVLVKIDQVN